MPITEILVKNATEYRDEVALVEITPNSEEKSRVTWKNYALIEPGTASETRYEMTWGDFDKKANRFANLLLTRGVKKGDKVGEVVFTVDGKEVGSVDILCDDNINKKEEKGFFKRIFKKTE